MTETSFIIVQIPNSAALKIAVSVPISAFMWSFADSNSGYGRHSNYAELFTQNRDPRLLSGTYCRGPKRGHQRDWSGWREFLLGRRFDHVDVKLPADPDDMRRHFVGHHHSGTSG